VDITSTFKGILCTLVFLTKPHEPLPAPPVCKAHEQDLRSPLRDIILGNTDAVDPKQPWMGIHGRMEAEMKKCVVQIRSYEQYAGRDIRVIHCVMLIPT
jgi:hypothetical protein